MVGPPHKAEVSMSGPTRKMAHLLDDARLPPNDLGNAQRLKRICDGTLIYVIGQGWAQWDGTKYDLVTGQLAAERTAQKLPELVAQELAAIKKSRKTSYDFCVSDLTQHEKLALRAGYARCYKAALEALKPDLSRPQAATNAAPHLINLANGTLDLNAFTAHPAYPRQRKQTPQALSVWSAPFFGPHQKAHLPTRATTTAYDPMAKCPNFRATLRLILPDKEIRACFQRCAGAMLYGENRSQAMLILRGGGGNGKTTLMNALSAVLGGYAGTCQPEMFLSGPMKNAGDATPGELDLIAAHMVEAAEPEKHQPLSGAKVKTFTGGDTQTGRGIHAKQMVHFRHTALPVLSCNRTPRILDEDEGLRRRLLFIPFDQALHKLPAKQRRDPQSIRAALLAERSGILNWMLDGYRDYARRLAAGQGAPLGMDPPPALLALKDRFLDQADPVGVFLASRTMPKAGSRITFTALFEGYDHWAANEGAANLSNARFREILIEKGVTFFKSGGISKAKDLAWRDD